MLQGPSESVDLPDQDSVEPSATSIRHESIKGRPGLLAAGNALVCEFLDNLPAAAPSIFPQFRQLHFGILIIEGTDARIKRDPSDWASGFLSESGATLLSSHCCLLVRRLWLAPCRCCCTGSARYCLLVLRRTRGRLSLLPIGR